MSHHSFKLVPAPFDAPSFESLFPPAISQSLLSSQSHLHNAHSTRTYTAAEKSHGHPDALKVPTTDEINATHGLELQVPGTLASLLVPFPGTNDDSTNNVSTGRSRYPASSSAGLNSGFLNFRVHTPPSLSSKPTLGSLEYDLAQQKYTERWDSWEEFTAWLKNEQEGKTVELRLSKTVHGNESTFKATFYYLCSRHGTGGAKIYEKKHPDWHRKVSNKRLDCPCSLRVKTYPGSSAVLGSYNAAHNHEIGNANLPYVRISTETREFIAGLLRLGVETPHILSLVHQGAYHQDDDDDTDQIFFRNSFITMSDIYRLKKDIDAETTRLHSDDGQSTLAWVKRLQDQGAILGFKATSDPPPQGSNLDADVFSLMIQTRWQEKMYRKFGNHIVGIDATHNTTVYRNLNLTTLMVRDDWGHGIPVAWMLASKGTEETITYFLQLIFVRNPSVHPRNVMSDRDHAQINSCVKVWVSAAVFLCWWHVLHAWQKHLRTSDHPELWKLLKAWVRVPSSAEFNELWGKIKQLAPEAFLNYLEVTWLPERYVKMWSNVYRQGRDIYEDIDTNMLLEAWHHVLKGKFLHGKRNHRMDHLLHCLVNEVLPHYKLKQSRQENGFQGVNLEVAARKEAASRASEQYTLAQITKTDDQHFRVQSYSNPGKSYEIDLDLYACSCSAFPRIRFCKHICAVQTLCGVSDVSVPLFEFDLIPSVVANPPLSPSAPSEPTNTLNAKAGPGSHNDTIQKLERVAARLREVDEPCFSLVNLNTALDECLDISGTFSEAGVLPTSQKVAPNVRTWNETKKVMPAVKTGRKRMGDPAYGAGGASGKKAKESPRSEPPQIPLSNTPQLPVPCPLPQAAVPPNLGLTQVPLGYGIPAPHAMYQYMSPYSVGINGQYFYSPTYYSSGC